MSDPRFAELLENYWCAAYSQGQEHREVDDEAGTAQDAEQALHEYVNDLTRELAEARDKALEEAAAWHDKQAKHLASIAKRPNLYEQISDDISSKAVQHMAHACAIRRLKEKP